MINIKENTIHISASVSCMDLCNLGNQIKEVEQSDVSFFHFDVVDGRFNNCFILGESTLENMRPITALPIEVHLAVYEPDRYIKSFSEAGADYIAVHYEAMENPQKTFDLIKNCGCEPVLAYKADTPPDNNFLSLAKECAWILKLTVNPGFSGQTIHTSSVSHIEQMNTLLNTAGISKHIQADGNINPNTIPMVYKAGATIFTGGTSGLFNKNKTISENTYDMIKSTF